MFKKLPIFLLFIIGGALLFFLHTNISFAANGVTCTAAGGHCFTPAGPPITCATDITSSGVSLQASNDCSVGNQGINLCCQNGSAAPSPTPTDTPTPTLGPSPTPTPTVAGGGGGGSGSTTGFVEDPEVTFIGQNAARSGLMLDWTLDDTNYRWIFLQPGKTNPLVPFWTTIRNIVYAMLVFLVLVSAFIMIATRGRSLTVRRFVPRFIAIVLLVTLSFAILQFLYNIGDLIQLFFLKSPSHAGNISQKDLLYVGWKYGGSDGFLGLRINSLQFAESAFISLLLVKLTAITYYVMVGILLVRKIILWFFIILSPIFPLLLFYRPVRNTAKIWIGEFFRWLLYAPLFSVFLAGLVHLWVLYIPLNFTNYTSSDSTHTSTDVGNYVDQSSTSDAAKDHFPTAINILLGAPQQPVCYDPTATKPCENSVNYIETFSEYVVALLMLWVVILLPFILLQIFLDYLATISINENSAWMQQILSRSPSFLKPPPAPSPVSPQPPGKYSPAGLARSLPFSAKLSIPRQVTEALKTQTPTQVPVQVPAQVNSEILKLTNLSVPTMQDIARYETSRLSNNITQQQQLSQSQQMLQHIANPVVNSQVRNRLITESQKGNVLAQNILQAANTVTAKATTMSQRNTVSVQNAITTISNPASATSSLEREKATELKQTILRESEKGNPIATTFISTMNTVNKTEISNVQQILQKLANPASITNPAQQQHFTKLKETLTKESANGNLVATSILQTANTFGTKGSDMTTMTKVREQLKQESSKGNKLAADLLATTDQASVMGEVQSLMKKLQEAKKKGDPLANSILALFAQKGVQTQALATSGFPTANRTQSVSIEDYESVKKMWLENYQKMDVPQSLENTVKDRKGWIQSDVDNITDTINLLSASDPAQVAQGMDHVSSILPFLLIGGFSQTEIIAYLKAKQQAAKETLETLATKEEEEDSTLINRTIAKAEEGHLEANISIPTGTVHVDETEDIQSPLKQITISQPVQVNVIPTVAIGSQNGQEILSLTNLTLPRMRDIAAFESAKLLKQQNIQLQKQMVDIQNKLEAISNQTNLAPDVKSEQSVMRRKLETAREEGNEVATAVLQAAQQVQPHIQLTDKQVGDIQNVLLTMTNLSNNSEASDVQVYNQLHQQLAQENLKANPLANAIYQTVDTITHIDVADVQEVLQKLADPTQLTTPVQQELLATLKQELTQKSQVGNPFATSVLNAVTAAQAARSDPKAFKDFQTQLEQESDNGNALAKQILSIVDHSKTNDKIKLFIQDIADQQGKNELAAAIMKAAGISVQPKSQSTTQDANAMIKLLQELVEPDVAKDPQRKEMLTQLQKVIMTQQEKKDPLADNLSKTIQFISDTELASLQLALQHIAWPERVSDKRLQEQCKAVKAEIEQEAQAGNSFAKTLASAVNKAKKSTLSPEILQKLLNQLQDEAKKGNSLAIKILSLNFSHNVVTHIASVTEQIMNKKDQGDPLAMRLAELLKQRGIQPVTQGSSQPLLPERNTIQPVDVTEYENVKQLWQENYEKADVPFGISDRKTWLTSEIQQITNATELLSRNDQASIQQGMQIVSEILPFLLLGGFSISETTLYLQAKKQAAKTVLDSLEKNETEQAGLVESKPAETPVKQQVAEIKIDK